MITKGMSVKHRGQNLSAEGGDLDDRVEVDIKISCRRGRQQQLLFCCIS